MATKPEIYTSRKALSLAKGIPLDHLKAAKLLNAKGITPSGRYNWKELDAWYKANKPAVLEYLEDNPPKEAGKGIWKERKDRALALIAEIELKDREQKTLDKDKVVSFLKTIAGSQAIVLRNMAQELPPRLLGKNVTDMGVILAGSYDKVCNIFKESLDKWHKT